MFKTLNQRNLYVKIVLGVVLGLICLAMVITLVPGPVGDLNGSPDTLARVAGQDITANDVQTMLARVMRNQTIPPMMQGLYVKQVLDQMVFQKAIDYEAQRLGFQVTPQEVSDRIRQILPTAFPNGNWIGPDAYSNLVQNDTGMTVPEFEEYIRQALLEEKFQQAVTSNIQVSQAEIDAEYKRKNDKVTISYALIKPEDLAKTINPSDSDLSAFFTKNASKYQIPERRTARYALLNLDALKQKTQISDDDLKAYYNQHLDDYKVPDRVNVEHILFKTVGKTDAEVAEIQKKAEDVLKQAKSGANFQDLAKKYSEDDGSKEKGGDLGWIVRGQTVPEFEKVAFSLPKGSISDLVKTQYGFHIIKILDKETAHTKSFDEVRDSILSTMKEDKVNQEANDISEQMATAVRQGNHQPLDALAQKFGLQLGDIPPTAITDPSIGTLGSSQELKQYLFQLRPGELSTPLQVDKGYAILSVTNIQPAHAATLAEVHDRVLADYRREKSIELAHTKAEELAKLAQSEALDKAAKSLGIDVKTSEGFTRDGTVGDLGSAKTFDKAFTMPIGKASPATSVQGNWVVYQVSKFEPANGAMLMLQVDSIRQQLLQSKQQAAFEAFRDALKDRLTKEGKLQISESAVKDFTHSS